ncbi:hypothetical protein KW429_11330 [Vibrio fluvialis]|nr:hypothetical protein [Vibrio fluvialis]MBY7902299.1 hypothetical protein [Vibrio fluvialis]
MSTSRADYRYIVKELNHPVNKAVWALECAPQTMQLPCVQGCLYIQFKVGTSEQEAKVIAQLLNDKAEFITLVN